ncbi:hypothetical protein INT48_005062 [Thamnidium elegans]|uniref:Adhesin domain-containing protein n=1 Tax=Thamnidium elegans TaxID=101142 RepID=A0A8H7SH82_9FUNG|nr:hypothetical protein INT48_005062 [Thamnidium elegans]
MSGPSNNRVEPRFFGAPELYNNRPQKKKEIINPSLWVDESNPPPPPPYTPNEPASSFATTNASAPPLESSPEYPIYPPIHYGTIPQPYPARANNTSDVATPSWPWISPPSAPAPSEYEVYSSPLTKKKTFCEYLVQIMFYVFCFCLLFRLIDLLVYGVEFAGSCAHGVEWTDVPKQIEYFAGLKIRVIGGSLSSGKIIIKTITSDSMLENGIIIGTVHATALVSPPSLINNSDLSFSITHFSNGTTLEFYLPQDLSSRACVRLDAIIYVPAGTPYLTVEVQNSHIVVSDETIDVNQLGLYTTNNDIDMYSIWNGKELSLSTTNGHLELYRSIKATDSIGLVSTNGMIRTRDNVNAVNLVYISTTNGAINIDKDISSQKSTKLITTNGHIFAYNVTGSTVEVRTSNSRVKIDHAHVVSTFDVQSTNAKMEVTLDSGKNVQAMLRTSNGELTATFVRLFDVSTSSYDKVSLVDPLGWAHLKKVTKSHLAGTRYSFTLPQENSDGLILMGTSNDNIHLNFAKED